MIGSYLEAICQRMEEQLNRREAALTVEVTGEREASLTVEVTGERGTTYGGGDRREAALTVEVTGERHHLRWR